MTQFLRVIVAQGLNVTQVLNLSALLAMIFATPLLILDVLAFSGLNSPKEKAIWNKKSSSSPSLPNRPYKFTA